MSEKLGVTVKREEDFSKWYLEIVRKGNFIDQRSPIKGFDVIMPWGYAIWEEIQKEFDSLIKKNGVKNCYFPLLIPESLIKKEEHHLKGFKAETLIATEVGDEKLEERLIIRPTSETIMYYMFALWIRSHSDLPFKINQWSNIVRWDTKVTKPFIRGREFLWQEGHTAHATKEDAEKWIEVVLEMYGKIYDMLAMSCLILQRPKNDTFAGADYSVVFDTIMQDGKIVQGPGTHMLGQNFSKPFDIKFSDKDGKEKYVWQTSWGLTTRQIGVLIMHHGDDNGAILPPAIAPYQVVIIPIPFKGKEEAVMKNSKEVENKLIKMGIRVYFDDREYSPGFKFNEWELRGVPLRIEIGPRDVANRELTLVSRLDGKKSKIKLTKMDEIRKALDSMQKKMLDKSKEFTKQNVKDAKDMLELKRIRRGFARTNWCGADQCSDNIKAETGGAEIRGTLYKKQEKTFDNCVFCRKTAKEVVYVAKAY